MKTQFMPDAQLLLWMAVVIVLDFITGIAKAVVTKQARTSSGFRKTITKFMQYGGSIAVSIVLNHTAHQNNLVETARILTYLNDGLVIFIIYIEVTSIFENLEACDNKSTFARFFIKPVLKLLTIQIKNNPLTTALQDKG